MNRNGDKEHKGPGSWGFVVRGLARGREGRITDWIPVVDPQGILVTGQSYHVVVFSDGNLPSKIAVRRTEIRLLR